MMSVPLSAADVLGEHVVFELESIDRMCCNAYVRKLTYPGGMASFFTHHRGASFASTCLADPISKRFVASILDFAAEREIPVVRFLKGQRKDDVALEHLARFTEPKGIYMVGVAQEKTSTFRTEKRRNPETGARYPWIVRASALVNQSTSTTRSAPRAALSYPRRSREGLEGRSLGPMAHPDPKGERNHRLPAKRRSDPGVTAEASRDPRDMAKAALPEAQSPEDAKTQSTVRRKDTRHRRHALRRHRT
jgi:hypothetical protein